MNTRNDHKKEELLEHSVSRESVHSASDDGEVRHRIAVRAYELYRERGCHDGHDLDDWLEAERSIVGPDITTAGIVLS